MKNVLITIMVLILIFVLYITIKSVSKTELREYKSENAFSVKIPKRVVVLDQFTIDFATYSFNLDGEPLMGAYIGMQPDFAIGDKSDSSIKHKSGRIDGLPYIAHIKNNPDKTESGEYLITLFREQSIYLHFWYTNKYQDKVKVIKQIIHSVKPLEEENYQKEQ